MKLGVFQAACGGCDFTTRLDRLNTELSGKDLDLVVCPELFATGYHIENTHQTLAQPAGGVFLQAFGELANHHGCAIAFGYPEASDGLPYNSAAVVGPDGALLANHRKKAQSPHSFEETSFENGSTRTIFPCGDLQVAVAICYEIEFPETARAAAFGGADLLIVPTALVGAWPVVAEKVVPARAFENGIYVAYANHGGAELSYTYLGGSRIVSPGGAELAVAGQGEELIAAEIARDQVQAAQARLPYLRDRTKIKGT